MIKRHDLLFIARWMQNPLGIGALAPSGPALTRAMAAQIAPDLPGTVVELGAGTGAITEALLKAGVGAENLVLVERDSIMVRFLARRFPDVRAIKGDATRLTELLGGADMTPIRAVISSLPLLSMPRLHRYAILEQSFELMGPSGLFVQYTYGLGSPVSERQLRRFGLEGRPSVHILRNLPPARIWRFTATAAAGASSRQAA